LFSVTSALLVKRELQKAVLLLKIVRYYSSLPTKLSTRNLPGHGDGKKLRQKEV
jgi:hypothetical protein